MEIKETFIDYYKILQCDKTASNEDLKKSYQRLALTLHPDKNNGSDREFLLIQKAWLVLRDPESRKQYDGELGCHEHNDLLLYDTVSLSEMDMDPSERVYTYNCRCGGTYVLERSDSMPSSVIIGCDECSFSIQPAASSGEYRGIRTTEASDYIEEERKHIYDCTGQFLN